MIYSVSRLETYKQCPAKFKFNYIDKIPQVQDTYFLEKGSVIHEAIAELLKGNELGKDILFKLDNEDLREGFKQVKRAVEYAKKYQIVGAEIKFNVDSNFKILKDFFDENGMLRGVIDCLAKDEDGIVIIDWKTGYTEPNRFQILSYAFIVWKIFNVAISKVVYYMTATGEEIEFRVEESDLIWAEKNITELIKAVEADTTFKATPNKYCRYCPYIVRCPLLKDYSKEIDNITNDEDAKKYISEVETLDKLLKNKKELVNNYIKSLDSGKIQYDDGKKYGVYLSETISKKRGLTDSEIASFIKSKNIDPLDYAHFEIKEVKTLEGSEDLYRVSKRKNIGWIEGE